MLDAAKGNAWIRSDHAIDKCQSRLNLIDEQIALRRIVGPRARSKTKAGAVGHLNRLGHVRGAIERCHRAKQLIVKRRRALSAWAIQKSERLPPSPRPLFFSSLPACVATLIPAPTLPVSVTAATRRSAITWFTRSEPISRV